jgi:hypothetical protein
MDATIDLFWRLVAIEFVFIFAFAAMIAHKRGGGAQYIALIPFALMGAMIIALIDFIGVIIIGH